MSLESNLQYLRQLRKLRLLGLLGILSLLSYTAMVVFSPLAYPGYDWMSMAVSELSAEGAPSQQLASQLNALFGPCGLISITAVSIGITNCKSKLLKSGIYLFTAMEWICNIGYTMFPWVSDAASGNIQNIMHLIVTALIVMLSVISIIFIMFGARKQGMKYLSIWAFVCFVAMFMGPIGTGIMPKAVFGIFERFSTFSAVVFNAVLGYNLYRGKFE